MNTSKTTKFILALVILIAIPLISSAFWPFSKKAPVKTEAVAVVESFDQSAKERARNKYKTWEEAFEKKNSQAVLNNQNSFSYSVDEINYLLDEVNRTAKKPTFSNAKISLSGSTINASATFHKIIRGNFSFKAQVISVAGKVRLSFNNVKLYGISMPTKWFAGPINDALDDYFSFLYKDPNYQGFTFTVDGDILKFKPEFKTPLNLSQN